MEIQLCQNCRFYTGDLTCLAFPDRIPDIILLGENNHSEVIEGQDGKFVFVDNNEEINIIDYL